MRNAKQPVAGTEPAAPRQAVADNSKFAVPLADGLAVEAVYYGSGTLCLSTQVGCAMGCPFCASGAGGLQRNLRLDELHAQLAAARERAFRPARLTLSGIGEPLANPEVVARFLLERRKAGLPVSLTTTGQPLARLASFLNLPHNGLMLSLHAGSPATHRRLIPRGPDFEALWRLLAAAWPRLSRRQRRRLGINYLLLAGVNDRPAELAELARRLQRFPELTLHLLTANRVAGSPFTSPPPPALDEVFRFLAARHRHVRRANRWRQRQEGGCGTLVVGGAARPSAPTGLTTEQYPAPRLRP